MINAPLLRKTMEWIEEHPETWKQSWWAVRNDCGTAYCFAGTALWLVGGEIAEGVRGETSCMTTKSLPPEVVVDPQRPYQKIDEAARRLLGLSPAQADKVFAPYNDMDTLRRHVAELTAGAA